MPTRNHLLPKINAAFDFAEVQLRRLVETAPDQFPFYTTRGKWDFSADPWTNWCEGFLGGQLWLIYERNRDPWWLEKAEHYSRLIESRKTDRNVHDLGFLFWPTYKRWYDLTSDPSLNEVVIQAGNTLSLRFQEPGQYLCSFLSENSLFIDIMMNVGIIFYAAQQTGDLELFRRANQHCLTTRRYLVRGDGSTAHEGIFDPKSGEFLYQNTQQGFRNDSCWARGLAWGLYGFSTAYEFTHDARFLATAEHLANFYVERTTRDCIPPNDWDEINPKFSFESSAAAIAAGGFWNLSKYTTDPFKARFYHNYAVQILDTLISSDFLAINTSGWEGILKHGIYHIHKNLGVDESVMWGDYFFLETLSKVMRDA
ncbi:MAG: glycoside hydrolase family 88 protein [Anaerolineales bacterium]|jgi:unsaturated chondroitin disaccharide hydrolase